MTSVGRAGNQPLFASVADALTYIFGTFGVIFFSSEDPKPFARIRLTASPISVAIGFGS